MLITTPAKVCLCL